MQSDYNRPLLALISATHNTKDGSKNDCTKEQDLDEANALQDVTYYSSHPCTMGTLYCILTASRELLMVSVLAVSLQMLLPSSSKVCLHSSGGCPQAEAYVAQATPVARKTSIARMLTVISCQVQRVERVYYLHEP